MVKAASGAITVYALVRRRYTRIETEDWCLTRPLMIPRFRERRGGALPEVGLEASLMPSAALGIESLPPILEGLVCRSIHVDLAVCARTCGVLKLAAGMA